MNSDFVMNEFPYDVSQTNIFTEDEITNMKNYFQINEYPTFIRIVSEIFRVIDISTPSNVKESILNFFINALHFEQIRAFYISKMLIIKCSSMFSFLYSAEIWEEM
jgi:hypothetical protein